MFQRIISFLIRNRISLSFIIVLGLLFENIIRKNRPHDIFSFQDPSGLIGLFLMLAGISLRSWAAGIICKEGSLATTGPYVLTRHPLYVGSFLMAFGFLCIIGDEKFIWAILWMVLMVYFPTIRKEELSLAIKFKEEWGEYTERVYMFFPRKVPRDMFANWSFSKWLNNREYRAFFTSLLALVLLKLWHEFLNFPTLFRGYP